METIWLVWLGIGLGCLLLELASGDLYLLNFAIGAVFALGSAVIGAPLWLDITLWIAVSLLCLAFVRPPLLKKLHGDLPDKKSNADALIGRTGTVTENIVAGGYGYVRIDGDEWRSVAKEGNTFAKGETVTVVGRDSIILTVDKR